MGVRGTVGGINRMIGGFGVLFRTKKRALI